MGVGAGQGKIYFLYFPRGDMASVHFLFASSTLYFPSTLSLSVNTSDSTSACLGENKHVHVELGTKDRNVYMLLLLSSFLFCFPNWAEIEKKMGGKDYPAVSPLVEQKQYVCEK